MISVCFFPAAEIIKGYLWSQMASVLEPGKYQGKKIVRKNGKEIFFEKNIK